MGEVRRRKSELREALEKCEGPAEVSAVLHEFKPPEEANDDDRGDCNYAQAEYENAERNLIQFVEKQVGLMRENVLWGGREPSYFEIQKSLSEYESVAVGLTSLYCAAKIESDVAREKYDDLYAHLFVEKKMSMMSLDPKKQPTAKELDMMVRNSNMRELSKLKAECIETESKRSAAERLVKDWQSFQFCLSSIVKISVAESDASRVSRDKEEFIDGQ